MNHEHDLNQTQDPPLYVVTLSHDRRAESEFETNDFSAAGVYRNSLAQDLDRTSARVRLYVAYTPDQVMKQVFAGQRVTDSIFEAQNMKSADFSSATIRDTTFRDVDLSGAMFSDASLEGVTFQDCSLQAASFESATLQGAKFVNCTLRATSFADAKLNHVEIERCAGRFLNASRAKLRDCSVYSSTFHRADFSRSELKSCYLNRVTFREANFRDATVSTTHFQRANMAGIGLNDSSSFRHCRYEAVNGFQSREQRPFLQKELQRDNRERVALISECVSEDPSHFHNHVELSARTGVQSTEGTCILIASLANPNAPERPIRAALIANEQGAYLVADPKEKTRLGQDYRWETELKAGYIRSKIEAKLAKSNTTHKSANRAKTTNKGR